MSTGSSDGPLLFLRLETTIRTIPVNTTLSRLPACIELAGLAFSRAAKDIVEMD